MARMPNFVSADPRAASGDGGPGSILMLVPHEPELDPRVLWTIDLCASILPTRLIALTTSSDKPVHEHRGDAIIERVNLHDVSASTESSPRSDNRSSGPRKARLLVPRWARRRRQAVHHFTTTIGYHSRFGEALWRRASSMPTRPSLIVCHDIYALRTALRLKRLWASRVLYDSHEYWPEADLQAEPWEKLLTRLYERRLIRQVDAVVTVSPPLARHLEKTYGLDHVISVPNACPREPGVRPSSARPISYPIRVLLQGQASPRRGFEQLLDAWRLLDGTRAVLEIRCPPNAYLDSLRASFRDLEEGGRLRFLHAVDEEDMVTAAAQSDIGVIPYPGDSLNHMYACPNKLAQYMHAGLAVLSNDLVYVRSVIEEYRCGLMFDLERPASVVDSVRRLVENPDELQKMKDASAAAARTFNWDSESGPYREAVVRLAGLTPAQLRV